MRRPHVVRCYVRVGGGVSVHELQVHGKPDALIKAARLAESCLGTVVLDPDANVLDAFGEVPKDVS